MDSDRDDWRDDESALMAAARADLRERARDRWAELDRSGFSSRAEFADFLNSLLFEGQKPMNATQPIKWTVNAIQEAMRARGSHWWSPDTMRFFGTKVFPDVWQGPGGVFFVTRDKTYDGGFNYTLRRYDPETNEINTHGELCGYGSRYDAGVDAHNLANQYGKGETVIVTEEHKPITVLAQFVADLERHGGKGPVSSDVAGLIINRAGRHHRLMEDLCNGTVQTDAEGESPLVNTVRERIRELAGRVGATGVIFSGDPRGCTVKLTFADGFTNDLGREGYCVPLSLRGDD